MKRKTLVIGKGRQREFYGYDFGAHVWVTSDTPINIFRGDTTFEMIQKHFPRDMRADVRLVTLNIDVIDKGY